MIIFPEMLWNYLKENHYTVEQFAQKSGLTAEEVWTLLVGEPLEYGPAKKFIKFLGAETVRPMLNWKAIRKLKKSGHV